VARCRLFRELLGKGLYGKNSGKPYTTLHPCTVADRYLPHGPGPLAEYVERMCRREKIDPVLVCYDGEDYILKDGFHRLEAALRLGRKSILAKITPGTRSEMTAEWQRYLAELKSNLANPAKPIG
jgi:hypothetical protein